MPDIDTIKDDGRATAAVRAPDAALELALYRSPGGADVWLKCENFQKTGSFKARGRVMAMVSGRQRRRPVIVAGMPE